MIVYGLGIGFEWFLLYMDFKNRFDLGKPSGLPLSLSF